MHEYKYCTFTQWSWFPPLGIGPDGISLLYALYKFRNGNRLISEVKMTEIWCVQIVATHGCIVYLYYSIACVRASGHSLASCTSALLKMGYCGLTCHPGKIIRYTHRGIDLLAETDTHAYVNRRHVLNRPCNAISAPKLVPVAFRLSAAAFSGEYICYI